MNDVSRRMRERGSGKGLMLSISDILFSFGMRSDEGQELVYYLVSSLRN